MQHLKLWLAWMLPLWALWMVLAGTPSVDELVFGAICAALSAGAMVGLSAQGLLRFHPRARWLRLAGRLAWRTVLDTGLVLAEVILRLLGRPGRGAFITVDFPAQGEDPVSVARRALATAGLSLPPNTYVIELDSEQGRLLVHQLVPARQPARDWRDLL